MARNLRRQEGDFEPDWTEKELEEKLAELRLHKSQNQEQTDEEEVDERPNEKAWKLAKILAENGEHEDLVQLAKLQVMMDPYNVKEWRLIAKDAARARRRQRPILIRFFLLLLKIAIGVFAVIVVAGIISAFGHH